MARNYENAKARRSNNKFFMLPERITTHPNFCRLSPHANKLIIDLGNQYYGSNNGDLCATWSWMNKDRKWKSKDTLNDTLRELEHYGLIVCTQHGGLNRPSLYAFTWLKIDKVERNSQWSKGETPGCWREVTPKFVRPSAKRKKRKTA